MANYNSNLISSFFSTGNNNSSNLMSFDYTMYSSIKSGAYKKLLNAYYKEVDNNSTNSTEDTDGTTKTAAQQKVNATTVRDEASAVNDAVEALNQSKLWEKKTVTKEDGTTSEEYDKAAIYKAVSKFAESYNALIESTGNSSDDQVLRRASNMVNYTKEHKDLLSKIGISVGTNNKLTVDEEAFKESNMISAKSVFTGAGSFGKSVQSTSSMIYGSAVSQLAKLATANMYSSDGTYNYISGSVYNTFM